MKAYIIQTGSSGNSTVLTDSHGNQLLIDCGLKYDKIINYITDFSKLAVLVTHEHQDHSESLARFDRLGVPCYVPKSSLQEQMPTLHTAENNMVFDIGNKIWRVLPIKVPHGDCACLCYIIYNFIDKKKVFWGTDLQSLPRLADLHSYDLVAVECNYDTDTLYNVTMQGCQANLGCLQHHSLESLVEWLSHSRTVANKLCLIHLSNHNLLNLDKAKELVQPYCKELYIGKKNVSIEL